jgi:hypothetical protein
MLAKDLEETYLRDDDWLTRKSIWITARQPSSKGHWDISPSGEINREGVSNIHWMTTLR